jgi:hypothetical protein
VLPSTCSSYVMLLPQGLYIRGHRTPINHSQLHTEPVFRCFFDLFFPLRSCPQVGLPLVPHNSTLNLPMDAFSACLLFLVLVAAGGTPSSPSQLHTKPAYGCVFDLFFSSCLWPQLGLPLVPYNSTLNLPMGAFSTCSLFRVLVAAGGAMGRCVPYHAEPSNAALAVDVRGQGCC